MSKNQVLVGFHAVNARLQHDPLSILEIFVDKTRKDKRLQSSADMAKAQAIAVHNVGAQKLDELSGGIRHQGLVAIALPIKLALDVNELLDNIENKGETAFLLILDGVTDPHNLGACMRTAEAAGVHGIVAPKDKSASINSTVQRVASGAADKIPYITVTNLSRTMKHLKDRGLWLIGTDDQADQNLYETDATRPIAWVMGAEGAGMRRLTKQNCDELVSIPMSGQVESLNVSVASALCMYETVRQRLG